MYFWEFSCRYAWKQTNSFHFLIQYTLQPSGDGNIFYIWLFANYGPPYPYPHTTTILAYHQTPNTMEKSALFNYNQYVVVVKPQFLCWRIVPFGFCLNQIILRANYPNLVFSPLPQIDQTVHHLNHFRVVVLIKFQVVGHQRMHCIEMVGRSNVHSNAILKWKEQLAKVVTLRNCDRILKLKWKRSSETEIELKMEIEIELWSRNRKEI